MGTGDSVILVISNAADATADFFEERLRRRSVSFVRLNTEDVDNLNLEFRVGDGGFEGGFAGQDFSVALEDISSVYFRRPRPVALELIDEPALRLWMQNEYRRAWGGVLLAAPNVRWVNSPIAIGGASYKTEQLARASLQGFSVPDSLVTSDPNAAERFCVERDWRVVVKPIGHGEIRGDDPESDQLVYTNAVTHLYAPFFDRIRNCPTLFQTHLTKTVDLRITVIGTECIAVALHSQDRATSAVDCRRDNMVGMRYSMFVLPENLSEALIGLTRSYGLYYAAIDMVLDSAGRYWFLELNPAGQWAWLEQEIGAPISDALIRCLTATSI